MGWLGVVELVGAALLLAVVLPLLGLYLRRRRLSSRGGVFDCALKLHNGNWATGLARYEADELQWFRTFSLSTRPKLVLRRDTTVAAGQRSPAEAEAVVLFSDDRILRVETRATGQVEAWEMAMSPHSVTGLMSWLEAAPPGGDRYSSLVGG